MVCPSCGTDNEQGALRCNSCGADLVDPGTMGERDPLSTADDETLAIGLPDQATAVGGDRGGDVSSDGVTQASGAAPGWSLPAGSPAVASTLPAGFVLAQRYRIVRLLGEGGMGSVYEAEDLELDRPIAIKLIRPDLAAQPEILQRFKQELILARQVTHKNVVRIFDLGTDQGLKYITMEFVDGDDLKSFLDRGRRFSPDEATDIIIQVCRALASAHDAGVVHRDLKPQNVMMDANGFVQVMDFGIARSMESSGLTRTGELLGTPAYMSPEQAKGEPTDARSDIFSLGIILYELLTGALPFEADTPFGVILKRTQERARPPIAVNPDIPDNLNRVVVRCLEPEPALRYSSVREIISDLESGRGPRAHTAVTRLPFAIRGTSRAARWATAAAAVALLGIAVLLASGRISLGPSFGTAPGLAVAPPGEATSLAIVPFRNASADPSLDWLGNSLAEMLRSDIGQSAQLRTVSIDRISQILADLKLDPGSTFDLPTINQLGGFSNAEKVLVGQYMRAGDQIRIDVHINDLATGTETSLSAVAATDADLLDAVGELATAVRENLDLSGDAVRALEAASFTPSSRSIDALRLFSEGLTLARQGNYVAARDSFLGATENDPGFALAFSHLAQAHADLGFDVEAEQASRTAMELSEGLPEFERYLISARHYDLLGESEDAVAAYERLLAAAPDDPELRFRLAALHEAGGDLDAAFGDLEAVLEQDPNHVEALYAAGRVEVRRGNGQQALNRFNQALSLAVGNDEARARILNGIGNTYRRLGQADEARQTYTQALEINQRLDQKVGIAANLTNIGHVELAVGRLDEALASYQEALDLRRDIGDRQGTAYSLLDLGNVSLDMGRDDDALRHYRDALVIHRDLGNDLDVALCLNNIAAVYMERGNYGDALTNLEQALRIHEQYGIPDDLGLTLYNLGETTANLGQFDDALQHYLAALDQWRSLGDDLGVAWAQAGIGKIRGYQGRFGAALASLREAVAGLESSGELGYWQFAVTVNHGRALAQAGQLDAAAPVLGRSLELARELENSALIAEALNFEGLRLLYAGSLDEALLSFEEAEREATAANDEQHILFARLYIDTVALRRDNDLADVVESLSATARRADTLGLKYIAAESQIRLAEARLETGDVPAARREVQTALNTSERLDMKALQAESYFILARADEADGDAVSAARRYERVRALIEEIREEAGGDDPLVRADLARMRSAAGAGAPEM